MPSDYPRLNQFPEWFTIEKDKQYQLWTGTSSEAMNTSPQPVRGEELFHYQAETKPDKPLLMKVSPL
jgi:hypothetical protein